MSVVRKSKIKARQVKAPPEALQLIREIQTAERRFAAPVERLGWLLKFVDLVRDGALKSGGDVARWNAELFAFAYVAGHQPQPPHRRDVTWRLGLTADELVEVSRQVKQAIEKLLAGDMWVLWLDRGKLSANLTSPKHGRPQAYYAGDSDLVLMLAVRELLASEGSRIAKCGGPGCEQLFVRRKRGSYCSKRCSQRARTLRYYEKHAPDERSNKRHDWYVEKVRREKGLRHAEKVRRNQRVIRIVKKESKP